MVDDLETQLLDDEAENFSLLVDENSTTDGNNNDQSQLSKRKKQKKQKKQKKRQRWMHWNGSTKDAPAPVEITFQRMQNRKVMRKKWGTYESDKPWTMLWVFLTLLLMFGVAGASFVNGHFSVKFNTGQVGFWSLVTVVTFAILVYTLTRILVVFRWMLYWLLCAEVLNLMLHKEYNLFGNKTPLWMVGLLAAAEIMTLIIYIMMQYVYPSVLASDWFRKKIGAQQWWEVRTLGPWTLTYANGFASRSTCAYRGETNDEGLPHGYGHWMDDEYHGEILTGWWEQGKPVGPFRSREYGSGYAFDNLMIGFVMATDDEFTTFKYFPSNDKKSVRVGVASVECSVSGAFFAHLPSASVMFGPYELKVDGHGALPVGVAPSPRPLHDQNSVSRTSASVSDCLARLRYLSTAHPLTSIQITAKQGRGVSVAGHIYNENGKSSSRRCQRLVIDVVYPDADEVGESKIYKACSRQRRLGIPLNSEQDFYVEDVEDDYYLASTSSKSRFAGDQASTGSGANAEDVMLTPALRSSMQFADSSLSVDEDEEEGVVSDDGPVYDDSDIESVEYDSGTFGLNSFALDPNNNMESAVLANPLTPTRNGTVPANISSHSLKSDEKERMLLDASSNFGSIPYGLDSGYDLSHQSSAPHLRVQGWRSTMDGHSEALIFIPGFNASLRNACERLGQFLAMGHFPPHIKPFIFAWPAGKVITYLYAMEHAQTERTCEAFGMMLDGLYDAGIRDVHILTHSMGVQALMGAFRDKENGTRSDVSLRFSLAPDFAESSVTTATQDTTEGEDEANHERTGGLRARTITLLNPDYPLAAFVDHGFATIRRVCDHVTVVGNRKDGALFWSEMGNGAMQTLYHYFGGQTYPDHLLVPVQGDPELSGPRDIDSCCPSMCACCFRLPEGREVDRNQGQDRLLSKQLTVGKCIFELFAPPEERVQQEAGNASLLFKAPNALYQQMKHVRGRKRRRKKKQPPRRFLDLDAIDTTWLESNVHALRHNYFNLNPVLVDDLHELIVTGRRASERSTLLHREGNIFSYCQAPACVVNDS